MCGSRRFASRAKDDGGNSERRPGNTRDYFLRFFVAEAFSARSTALGSCSITDNRMRAARSGLRRPCSQSRKAATSNPKRKAKPACVSLSDFLMCRTLGCGMESRIARNCASVNGGLSGSLFALARISASVMRSRRSRCPLVSCGGSRSFSLNRTIFSPFLFRRAPRGDDADFPFADGECDAEDIGFDAGNEVETLFSIGPPSIRIRRSTRIGERARRISERYAVLSQIAFGLA